jgi:hypothetical protein
MPKWPPEDEEQYLPRLPWGLDMPALPEREQDARPAKEAHGGGGIMYEARGNEVFEIRPGREPERFLTVHATSRTQPPEAQADTIARLLNWVDARLLNWTDDGRFR